MPSAVSINKADPPSTGPASRVSRRLLRWVERGFALFGAMVVVAALTLDYAVVVSPSMSPTLRGTNYKNGDRVITEKVTGCLVLAPRRWEVITYLNDEGIRVMKRVVAFPGETVQINRDRQLVIDGRVMEGPPSLHLNYLGYGNVVAGNSFLCTEGYYVLGDDTKDSDDSRFNGPVTSDRIVGRAWLIVRPWSRFGLVNP